MLDEFGDVLINCMMIMVDLFLIYCFILVVILVMIEVFL